VRGPCHKNTLALTTIGDEAPDDVSGPTADTYRHAATNLLAWGKRLELDMDVQVKGKRVLVTGGNSGIGEAMALSFADAGADVAINYVSNEPAAKKLVQAIQAKGRRSFAVEANVADYNQVVAMFDELDRVWVASTCCSATPGSTASASCPTRC
jgi:hypothetical protein